LTIIITSIKDDLIFYVPNARSISNSWFLEKNQGNYHTIN
jgi:hypothetical protein